MFMIFFYKRKHDKEEKDFDYVWRISVAIKDFLDRVRKIQWIGSNLLS